ncbi:EscU/YscU/HrcU family type III secretion system export apparatus switch protein [Granulicella sibirica]|uniref:Flagellar biosynthesis protein FlhB n=1 Tax=Granulicella sibirica TaxID=2479048 RepID=A0A4Q0SZB4_9BACT|nr:EscU/YscU/HrcU family type III secretion system export apparatus switch protein [Granulicella sibirica]RXH56605.1 Flagellar biosynthesis protein FlhB [Granulicella sibirica]
MSDQQTEKATPQRKQKAREKGDRVRSRELLSAVSLLGGVLVLGAMAKGFVARWGSVFQECLRTGSMAASDEQKWTHAMRTMLAPALLPVGMVMAASFLGALGVGVAQSGGLSIHPNALELKFDRLNPVTNIVNLFSLRSFTRLVKSLVPAAVMVVFGWGVLKSLILPMPVMAVMRLPSTFAAAYGLAVDAAWVTLAWSGLDFIVEYLAWNKRLMMSKQETREEMKEAMGNPQVKNRVRQLQHAMRKRRVKADISRASVVITNPTHYAVALEFSFDTLSAPTVLAKGRDLHAKEIREEALWAGIPLIENPPLARSLYKMVEPGQSIPFELYSAVAGILAYLYRQKVEDRIRQDRERRERDEQREREQRAQYKTAVAMRDFGGGM